MSAGFCRVSAATALFALPLCSLLNCPSALRAGVLLYVTCSVVPNAGGLSSGASRYWKGKCKDQ